MAHLVASGGHRRELARSGEVVGSAEGASIRVPAGSGVAGQHYQVGETMSGWQLFPMASTTLNGTPVAQLTPLVSGDRIGAGSFVLEFEGEVKAEAISHPLAIEADDEAVEDSAPKRVWRRWKLPVFPTRAAALLVVVGAIAAWKADMLPMIGNSSAHFKVLADYAPAGTNFAASVDVQDIGEFYEHWRPQLSPGLPKLAEINERLQEESGLGLAECERVSVVLSLDDQTDLSLPSENGYAQGAVVLFTFEGGRELESSIEASWPGIIKEANDDGGTLYTTRGGDVALRVIDGRHLLVGTPQNLAKPADDQSAYPCIKRLHRSRMTFAFTADVPAGTIPPIGDFGHVYPLPTSTTIGVDLAGGIKFGGRFEFANKDDALRVEAIWDQSIEWARSMLEPESFREWKSHVKMNRHGSSGSIEIKASEDDLAKLAGAVSADDVIGLLGDDRQTAIAFLEDLGSGSLLAKALTPRSKPRTNAENLVSMYLSAVAAGSPELVGVSDRETAVRAIIDGVKGGEEAGFDALQFKVPLSEEDLAPALEHVRWDAEGARLEYLP